MDTLAHSISEARSRIEARSVLRRSRRAASAIIWALWSSRLGRTAADGLRPEELELAQGGGVEGAGLDVADAEVAEAAAHFGRRPRR